LSRGTFRAVIPSRPKVNVLLRPGVIQTGSSFEAIVRLESARLTRVDAINVRFWGEEQLRWSESYDPARRIVDLVAVDRPKQIARGAHEIRVRFAVPATAPPTYGGTTVHVNYTLQVHVDIPWWPDRVTEFTVPVAPAPSIVNEAGTRSRVVDSVGLPYVEAAVDRLALAPGDVITGRVSFSRTKESALGRVKLRLRCVETTRFGMNDGPNFVLELPIARHRDGDGHAFRLKIPDNAVPAFACSAGSTAWRLDLDAEVSGREVTLLAFPLQIVAKGTQGIDGARELPLVGDQRRAELNARVARACGIAYDAGEELLRGAHESVSYTVGRGADGSTEATLQWRPLGIDLSLGPARWNDFLSPLEITVGEKAFDERFQLRGR
jgi:hypothetical protein